VSSNFSPAWFLRGPHAQTLWGRITRLRRLVKARWEMLATSDGDKLVFDYVDAPRIEG
jgi:predicted alpha/beta-fold hydrolase